MPAALSSVRVSVLGAGAWGTALAVLASARANTLLWARDESVARHINEEHHNSRYLSDVVLPCSLRSTASFEQAMAHVCQPDNRPALIILGVPMSGLTDICVRLAAALANTCQARLSVVWTCKGFHADSGLLPHQIVQQALAAHPYLGLGALSGPSFAHEVAQGLPVALTLASQQPWTADPVLAALHGSSARIYTSSDLVGVEVGGALKNIIAIACGISDGLGLGTNARAALITRGLAEMQRVGLALGGQAETFSGLTGLGDLVLTATGALSRNRQVGLAIGHGHTLNEILASGVTAEGVRCARAALAIGRQYRLELPITEAVCDVLFEGLAPRQAVSDLLAREARPESSLPSH